MTARKIIIGALYGDEGKGITTARLVTEGQKTLVTRFNGGPNAGHTVVLADGSKHVFSQFGSGTLQGAATRISKYMYLEPMALLQELQALKKIQPNLWVQLYIDPETELITPYDIINSRTNKKNDTTGMGMIETFHRIKKKFSLKFQDLDYEWVLEQKLKNIYGYYATIQFQEIFEEYLQACRKLKKIAVPWNITHEFNYKEYLFEGAQGILLDPDVGFFPYCTPSRCTSQNALELIYGDHYEIHYVIRAYQTRHGDGPLSNTDLPLDLINTEDETNIENRYQGKFRKSVLDLDLLNYSLTADVCHSPKRFLHITCLDQVTNWKSTSEGKIITLNPSTYNLEGFTTFKYFDNKISIG